MLLKCIQIAVIILTFWTAIFQVIVPLLQGRPFFPIFRREKLALEIEIAGKLEERDLTKLQEVSSSINPHTEKEKGNGTIQ